jgi:hypothetical protein
VRWSSIGWRRPAGSRASASTCWSTRSTTRSARTRVSGTCCAASASTSERHAEGRRFPSSRCDRESAEDCLSSKTVMGPAAAVEQASLSETLRTGAERGRGAAPRQLVHVTEKVRVGSQGRQVLEEEGQAAALSQDGRREILEDAMPVQQPCRRDRTDPWDAGISVGSVADEGEEIGILLVMPVGSATMLAPVVAALTPPRSAAWGGTRARPGHGSRWASSRTLLAAPPRWPSTCARLAVEGATAEARAEEPCERWSRRCRRDRAAGRPAAGLERRPSPTGRPPDSALAAAPLRQS